MLGKNSLKQFLLIPSKNILANKLSISKLVVIPTELVLVTSSSNLKKSLKSLYCSGSGDKIGTRNSTKLFGRALVTPLRILKDGTWLIMGLHALA